MKAKQREENVKCLRTVFISIPFALGLPLFSSIAQEQIGIDSLMQRHEKQELYESQKKVKLVAIVYAWFLPSAGHAYADNWGRGVPFALGRIGGMVLFGLGSKEGFILPRVDTIGYVGVSIALVSTIWELIDAAAEVGRYNERLQSRLIGNQLHSFNLHSGENGIHIGVSFTF